jgi:hypothetical protein
MHEYYIPIRGSSIESVDLVVDLISYSITPLSLPPKPLSIPIMFFSLICFFLKTLYRLKIDLIGVEEGSALDLEFLALGHFCVRLIHIIN